MRRGKAGLGGAGHGLARHGRAQGKGANGSINQVDARPGEVRQGWARRGVARHGMARRGRARPAGKGTNGPINQVDARPGEVKEGWAGRGLARPGRVRQGKGANGSITGIQDVSKHHEESETRTCTRLKLLGLFSSKERGDLVTHDEIEKLVGYTREEKKSPYYSIVQVVFQTAPRESRNLDHQPGTRWILTRYD